MKRLFSLLIPAVLFIFLITGCYTQLYKPDMESARAHPQASLYNRYDSTAIDTSLRRDSTVYYEQYPDYGWSYWGRPRHEPIWGWNYDNYMPDYYWGYYGYDNYYGRPWWDNYNGYYPYYPGGSTGTPAQPPDKRSGGRRSHDTGGGSYATPPASSPPPAYGTPPPSNPPAGSPPPDNGDAKKDDGKRGGKRGH
ncbi:MAG TPA: hypothetical protein VGL38_16210 [bacterium]|jgi:hypothetical protein